MVVVVREWAWAWGCDFDGGLGAVLEVLFVHAKKICMELLHHG